MRLLTIVRAVWAMTLGFGTLAMAPVDAMLTPEAVSLLAKKHLGIFALPAPKFWPVREVSYPDGAVFRGTPRGRRQLARMPNPLLHVLCCLLQLRGTRPAHARPFPLVFPF